MLYVNIPDMQIRKLYMEGGVFIDVSFFGQRENIC